VTWHEEEGGMDPCRGFRRFGEAKGLATESKPWGEFARRIVRRKNGEPDGVVIFFFFLYFSDAE
jgi:hypothetical protein